MATIQEIVNQVWSRTPRSLDGQGAPVSDGSYLDNIRYAVWTYPSRSLTGGLIISAAGDVTVTTTTVSGSSVVKRAVASSITANGITSVYGNVTRKVASSISSSTTVISAANNIIHIQSEISGTSTTESVATTKKTTSSSIASSAEVISSGIIKKYVSSSIITVATSSANTSCKRTVQSNILPNSTIVSGKAGNKHFIYSNITSSASVNNPITISVKKITGGEIISNNTIVSYINIKTITNGNISASSAISLVNSRKISSVGSVISAATTITGKAGLLHKAASSISGITSISINAITKKRVSSAILSNTNILNTSLKVIRTVAASASSISMSQGFINITTHSAAIAAGSSTTSSNTIRHVFGSSEISTITAVNSNCYIKRNVAGNTYGSTSIPSVDIKKIVYCHGSISGESIITGRASGFLVKVYSNITSTVNIIGDTVCKYVAKATSHNKSYIYGHGIIPIYIMIQYVSPINILVDKYSSITSDLIYSSPIRRSDTPTEIELTSQINADFIGSSMIQLEVLDYQGV